MRKKCIRKNAISNGTVGIFKTITYNVPQIKTVKDMKEEILSIASDLREGHITSNEAKRLLLVLFGVGKSLPIGDVETPFGRIHIGKWGDEEENNDKGISRLLCNGYTYSISLFI